MATYVLSDVHGHRSALENVLASVNMKPEDELYVLGDMVDRGPDPVGVMRVIRELANCHVLMGNHERLMLDAIEQQGDNDTWFMWLINGGASTAEGLQRLAPEAYASLVTWVKDLPLYEIVTVTQGDTPRDFLLCHAGIIAPRPRVDDEGNSLLWDAHALEEMMKQQSVETLLWIREEYLRAPTGLLRRDGRGPIVVAGHTPTPYAVEILDHFEPSVLDKAGRAQVIFGGGCADTGGVPDRVCIDCAAAAGSGIGQVGVLRLEDFATWYAPIEEGE